MYKYLHIHLKVYRMAGYFLYHRLIYIRDFFIELTGMEKHVISQIFLIPKTLAAFLAGISLNI